jgi:hypothetical protein
MAVTKIQPTGVNSEASFTFANVTATGNVLTSNLSASGNVAFTGTNINLGTVSNIKITGGTADYVLKTDGTGNLSWVAQSGGGGGGTPGGSNTYVQFNDGSSFGGSANFTFDKTTNVLSVNGNVAAGNANLGNLATANFFSGSGNLLSNIQGANVSGQVTYAATANAVAGSNISGQVSNALVSGTVYTNAQPNITSVGTLTSLSVTGNVTSGNASITGKVYASDFINGGTGIYLAAGPSGYINFFTSTGDRVTITDAGNISAVGNAIASYFIGNGSALSSLTGANVSGEVSYAATANAVAGGNVSGQVGNALIAGTVYTNAQPNITSVGTLASLSVSGNANIGNIALTGTIVAGTGSGGNITNADYVIANFFQGNGSLLTSLTGANVSGEVSYAATANAVAGGNVSGQVANALVSGTVYTNAQPNITSVGTLTSLSVSGNALVNGNLIVDGTTTYVNTTNLLVQDPIIEQGGGANGAALTTNDGKDRGIVLHYYSGATIDAFMGWDNSNAEFSFGSNVSMSGEVATFNTLGNIRSGNASLGNLATASFFSGSGNLLSNIQGSNVTGAVAYATTANAVSGSNVSGEVAFAATANSVAGGNVTGTVSSATTATTAATVTTAAQPNITSVGTLTGLTVGPNSSIVLSGTTGYVKANSLQGLDGSQALYLGYSSVAGAIGIVTDLTVGTGGAGNLNANGTISATANVVAGNVKTDNLLYANGTAWSLGGGGGYGNSNVATFLASFGSNTLVTTGNITTGNLIFGSGVVTGTGTITAGNLAVGAGYLSTTGNANVGNVFVASTGVVSTAGTITAGNLAFGAGFVSGTGLITAGNLSATANLIAGNVKTDNLLYANGAAWTLGGGSYGNSDVATFLSSGFGSNTISTTSNISAGNIKTDNLLYANGTAWSLGGGGGSYSNTNVTSYLPTHTGNVGAPGSTGYLNGNGFYLTGISGGAGASASISNGSSNINIATSAGNVVVAVGGTAAVATFSTTGMVIGGGNLTVGTGTNGNLSGLSYTTSNAYAVTTQVLGSVSGVITTNLSLGTYLTATTAGATTWNFSNFPAAGNTIGVVLELANGGTAAQTWTNVRWAGGIAPTLTASGTDVLVFITDDSGSNWRGSLVMLDSK